MWEAYQTKELIYMYNQLFVDHKMVFKTEEFILESAMLR
jgi:hypothetical protein